MADEPIVWIDSHCHLAHDRVDDDAVAEAAAADVVGLVTVGCDVVDSAAHRDVAVAHPSVVATAGVHPHEARHGTDGLAELLDGGGFVAVGECGLDYHYDHSPRDVQREVFAAQIALAHERGLPLVIHSRSAWEDTFDVLDAEGTPERTVFHCFTGGPDEARRALDRGAHLSFSGIVTFPSAPEVREAAVLCPLDRLLVETDSPYLAPVPHRGRTNRPALVAVVGDAVAEVRAEPVATVATATTATARRLFSVP
ncbi:MAG: TatD family hydrolase [Actinomycetota bacterium]